MTVAAEQPLISLRRASAAAVIGVSVMVAAYIVLVPRWSFLGSAGSRVLSVRDTSVVGSSIKAKPTISTPGSVATFATPPEAALRDAVTLDVREIYGRSSSTTTAPPPLDEDTPKSVPPMRLPTTSTATVEGRTGWHSPLVARRQYSTEIPQWPENEKRRGASVLTDLLFAFRAAAMQSQQEPKPGSGSTSTQRRRVRLLGLTDDRNETAFACGRWNRFWVVVECAAPGPAEWSRCALEYHMLDVQIECPVAKVSVDRIYPVRAALSNGAALQSVLGLYEVQFYVRKCHAEYHVGVDLLAAFLPQWSTVLLGNGETFPRGTTAAQWSSPAGLYYPASMTNATVAILDGVDITPMDRACDSAAHFPRRADRRDLFRYGAWVRLPNGTCDGVHCDGSLTSWETDGWVWAPDLCRIQLFSNADIRRVLSNTRVFAWGASTLRQPMAILSAKLKRRRKRRRVTNSTVSATPHAEAQQFDNGLELDIHTARCYRFHQASRPCLKQDYNPATDALGIDTWPMYREFRRASRADLVLIEVTAWMADDGEVNRWMKKLRRWTEQYAGDLEAGNWTPGVAEIFHGPVSWENSVYVRHSRVNFYVQRLRSWLTEDYLVSTWPEVLTFINRHDMTLPLHFGTQYVQGNHHYGATATSCAHNLVKRKGLDSAAAYAPEKCIRKVYGDTAVILAWLNLYSLARGGVSLPEQREEGEQQRRIVSRDAPVASELG